MKRLNYQSNEPLPVSQPDSPRSLNIIAHLYISPIPFKGNDGDRDICKAALAVRRHVSRKGIGSYTDLPNTVRVSISIFYCILISMAI